MPKRTAHWLTLGCFCLAATATATAAVPARIAHGSRFSAQLRVRALIERDGRYAGTQYQQALRQRAMMIKQQTTVSPAGLIHWSELGPGNVGGRLNAIWVDPANTQHILAGSASGGLWQSSDGGSSWSEVGEFPGSLTIGAIAALPGGALLVGTGDAFTASGDGLFTSSDGGQSWTGLSSSAPRSAGDFWALINSIAVSTNGVILAATGDSDGLSGGIARSTDDGQTWSKVWTGAASSGTSSTNTPSSMDVAFDPGNASDAIADDENGGVLYSSDGGMTWTNGAGLPDTSGARVSVAFDPSVSGSAYALVDNNNGSSPSGQVYHSSDGGKSWTLLADTGAFINQDTGTSVGALCDNVGGGTPECQGWYDNVILVEPHASGAQPTILAGGINLFASSDGGSSWTETGSWVPSDSDHLHADQHVLTYVPSTGRLYVGNDGGFFKQLTVNTWQADNEGLAVTQLYGVSGHQGTTSSRNPANGTPVTPILAGAQDNGTLLYQGYAPGAAPQPDDWLKVYGGDGGLTQVDPADGNDVYGEYVNLALLYSSDGGPNTQSYTTLPPDSNNGNTNANFIAPFALVPNGGASATEMFAGGASLWLGTGIQSANPTWTAINDPAMPASTANSNYLSAIAVDPSDGNDVWIGYDNGELWHSTDALGATPAWARTGSGVLPARKVESLWIVPGESGTVYVTFGGYPSAGAASNVWVTGNGGVVWTDIGAGLPSAPVYSLVTHPAYPLILYAGTLTGVYTSDDDGQSWNASAIGPANVEVRQLSWFDTSNPDNPTLLAATYGRGAWLGSPAYNPSPTLAGVTPATLSAGSSDTTVTLNGSGFVQGVTTATLDGGPWTVTFQSSTQLQATLTASLLAAAATHTFVVSNPAPGGGTSNGATVTVDNPLPVLNSVSPSSAQAGAQATPITLTGSGFLPSSIVEWNGSALSSTYQSSTTVSATIPSADLSSAGDGQITVSTGPPGGGTSSAVSFTVNARGGGGALGGLALTLLLGANGWRRRRRGRRRGCEA